MSREDADEYKRLYWEAEKELNPSGEVPYEYSFPGTPREIELDVPDEWAGRLHHGDLGVRVYQHEAHLSLAVGKQAKVVRRGEG